ncbi:MAG TPA: secretin and TonB N-terminal domain-containing protein [Lacipirellulaceae bacterium]|jgi:Flp pilus assembly secretin CpaC
MNLVKSQSDTQNGRAALRLALCAVSLACCLLLATGALAQNSDMHHLFDGVRRGSATPEVLQKDRSPFDADDDTKEPQDAPHPTSSLQQPDRMSAGVVLAAHTTKPTKAQSAMETSKPEALPLPQISGTKLQGKLPMSGSDAAGSVDVSTNQSGNVSMVVRDASLSKVLALLAQTYHLNIVAANDIDVSISITLNDVPIEQALTAILSVANYTWVERNGIILVTSMTEAAQLPADIQGRQIQVFELDFAGAAAVSEAVTAMLSPIGKMSIIKSDPQDNRRTREMIVVEDQPPSIARIAAYIDEVDQAPRQVLMEAHILQVTLKDDNKCGVDLDGLLRAAGSNIKLQTAGLASDTATPSFLATVEGGDLGTVIEALETTTDTKTLGSPKVLVLNHQEAMIHVGDDIGYQGSQTTTQTSTFQNVQFLQVGVVLHLVPNITRDDRVLLHVKPEVSTGAINPQTNIPDKTTAELETDVMLRDGQGMIIGGLIKETDSTVQSKIPYLGDLWKVGILFKRSEVNKERSEILVAIVPRIQPFSPEVQAYTQGEMVRAVTPLFQGPLCRTSRPWDPVLPDGRRVVKPFVPSRLPLPAVQRSRDCTAPWPRYDIPHEPYPVKHFDATCDDPNMAPNMTGPQPEISGEYLPQPTGAAGSDGAVISDH